MTDPEVATPAEAGPIAAELLIEAGGTQSVVRLEGSGYRVGRAPSNQIFCPNDSGLSREHLIIERQERGEQQEGSWVVRDLGSTNGTLLNGERLTEPRVLRSGDRIAAGQVSITYRDAESGGTVVFTDEPSATSSDTTMSESLEGLVAAESEEGRKHMQALITAGRELATHLSLDRLFELILDLSIEASGAARGVLMTLERGKLQPRASRGHGLRISSHVRDLVIQERRSLLVRDALLDAALASRASIAGNQIRSMMAVPLQTEDRVIGLIYLDSSQFVKEFTRQDLSLLTVMANMAAIRIENARLTEVEQAERVRMRELEHAATIQRSILPSQFPPFPDRTEFELHASMVVAKEVGGDLFDFFLIDEDRLAFVLGDVSGKGVPAALFMAIACTLLRASARHHRSAGECLTFMNQALVEQHASGMFVTLFYGILNTRTGALEFSNAGHCPPYIYSPDGSFRTLKDRCGPMLGVFERYSYTTRTAELGAAEGILLYTDGVTEARNHNGEFYEESRLEEYLAAHASQPVEDVVRGIHAEVERFEAGATHSDDITVLALRRHP